MLPGKKFVRPSLAALVAFFALALIATAGSLTPSASPAGTMYSLANVYDVIASSGYDSTLVAANQNGSLLGMLKYINANMPTGVTSNSLDFDELVNAMTLDANTSIASAGYTFSILGNVGIGTATPYAKLTVTDGGLAAENIILASSSASIFTPVTGYGGYTLISGGIGTGGIDAQPATLRLTGEGNLVNIGAIQAGQALLTRAGTFVFSADYSTPNAGLFEFADIDGDSDNDMAVVDLDGSNNIAVFFNAGDGTFGASTTYNFNPWTIEDLALADFNGDGWIDIVVTSDEGSILVTLNNGNGTFGAFRAYAGGILLIDIVAADFNGDGRADVVAGNDGDDVVSVFLNRGNGTFSPAVNYDAGTGTTAADDITAADFNGDGKMDVAAGAGGNEVVVFLNNGNGTFGAAAAYVASPIDNTGISTADFNSDGAADLVVANGSSTLSVLLNAGDGTFGAPTYYATGVYTSNPTVGDVNGDGMADLAMSNTGNSGEGTVSVLINNGDGTFAAAVNYSIGSYPVAVELSDVNGDGKNDMAATSSVPGTISVFLNQATAMFSAKVTSGYVGIGKAVPATMLDVSGSASISSNFEVSGTASLSTLYVNGAVVTSSIRGLANTSVGSEALLALVDGEENTAVGSQALYSNVSAFSNTAVGAQALFSNTTGASNNAFGVDALGTNTIGAQNVALGNSVLGANTSGSYNVVIGNQALSQNTEGSNNIGIGYGIGATLTTGSNNIIIGYQIDFSNANASNSLNIGNLIYGTGVDGSNTVLSTGNIGIGTATPETKFEVVGTASVSALFVNGVSVTGGSGGVTSNSLNFDEFVASMSLDAPLEIASNGFSINFNDTTLTTGILLPEMTGAIGTLSLQTIGDSTHWYKDAYIESLHLGPASLYMNGQKILSETGSNMNFTTSTDQNLIFQTAGTGNLTVGSGATGNANIQTGGTGNINLTTGGNGNINLTANAGALWLTSPTIVLVGATEISGAASVSSLTVGGVAITGSSSSRPASNSLDWDELANAMTLDANTTITGGVYALTFDHASVSGNFEVSGIASISQLTVPGAASIGGVSIVSNNLTASVISGTTRLVTNLINPYSGTVTSFSNGVDTTFKVEVPTTTTNTVNRPFWVGGNVVGAATTGYGAGIKFTAESSTTNSQEMGLLDFLWTDATHATRTSRFDVSVVDSAVTNIRMSILGNGSVGIGTTTPETRLEVVGTASVSRMFVGLFGAGTGNALCHTNSGNASGSEEIVDCTSGPSADYMELYPMDPSVEEGEIVAPDASVFALDTFGNKVSKLVRSQRAYQSSIIGITSVASLGTDFNMIGRNLKPEDNPKPLALAGRVRVKVSTQNGPIAVGDRITASDIPGVGMKATRAGTVVGSALESLDTIASESKRIMVFVQPQYWAPEDSGGSVFKNMFAAVIKAFKDLLGIVFSPGGVIEAQKLCLGDSCITQSQLQELLQRGRVSAPTDTPTPTPTPTQTPTPSETATPTPSGTPTPTPVETPTPSDTVTPTPIPSETATPLDSPTPTP